MHRRNKRFCVVFLPGPFYLSRFFFILSAFKKPLLKILSRTSRSAFEITEKHSAVG